jgi:hypothetical protein
LPKNSAHKGASAAVAVIIILILVAVGFLVFGGQMISGITPGAPVGTVGPGTQGVVIQRFFPEASAVETVAGENENFVYTAIIKNLGEVEATNVKAELVGGLGAGQVSEELRGRDSDVLAPADPQRNIPGEETTATWALNLPDSLRTDVSYTTTARVTYKYSTVNNILFRVVNREFVRQAAAPGVQQPAQSGIISAKTTLGPFSIVATSRTTVLAGDSGDIRITYQITNTGGGRAFTDAIGDDKILVKVTPIGANLVNPETCNNVKHRLSQGTTKILTCTIRVSGVTTFTEIPISLELQYNYYVQQSTSITILKKLV